MNEESSRWVEEYPLLTPVDTRDSFPQTSRLRPFMKSTKISPPHSAPPPQYEDQGKKSEERENKSDSRSGDEVMSSS